jgi:hypothetical protein
MENVLIRLKKLKLIALNRERMDISEPLPPLYKIGDVERPSI